MAGAFGFDAAGTRRIVDAVRKIERSPPTIRNPGSRVSAPPPWPVLGKITSGNSVKGDTNVTVRIYNGDPGAEVDSGIDLTPVCNRFGSVSNGKWVLCLNNGWGWYLAAAE